MTGSFLFLSAKLGAFCAIYVHFLSFYVKSIAPLSSLNDFGRIFSPKQTDIRLCATTNWKRR